jgi:hypothetical protein
MYKSYPPTPAFSSKFWQELAVNKNDKLPKLQIKERLNILEHPPKKHNCL